MTKQQRSKQAWAKWRKLVAGQARSGETVAAFCRRRGLCEPHFYWWKKRLGEAIGTKFVEVKLAPPAPIAPWAAGDPRLEVRLANGQSPWVGPGFDAKHVRSLLAASKMRAIDLRYRPRAFSFSDFSGEYASYFSTGIGTEPRCNTSVLPSLLFMFILTIPRALAVLPVKR